MSFDDNHRHPADRRPRRCRPSRTADAADAERRARPRRAEATPLPTRRPRSIPRRARSSASAEPSVDAEDLIAEAAPVVDNPANRPGKWFVVHTQSGYEKKVKQNLEARTSSMNMEGRIHEVVIPMEDVIEFKNGKKVVVQKKMFPGYLLVRCHLDDDSWYVIRNTPGVTGFVGQGTKPSPLRRQEVETFLSVKVEGEEGTDPQGPPRLEYEISETVRVKEGPFADFSGEIVEINEDQLKVKVLVNIFGRETPVELEFARSRSCRPTRLRSSVPRNFVGAQNTHGQEKGHGRRQDPDPRRAGHPGPARRHRARPARRGDHGLLQGLQRPDRSQPGHHHPGRDHDLRGSLASPSSPRPRRPPVLLREAAGVDKASSEPRQGVRRLGHRRADRGDRQDQAPRPERQRPRGRQEDQVEGTARSMGLSVN